MAGQVQLQAQSVRLPTASHRGGQRGSVKGVHQQHPCHVQGMQACAVHKSLAVHRLLAAQRLHLLPCT